MSCHWIMRIKTLQGTTSSDWMSLIRYGRSNRTLTHPVQYLRHLYIVNTIINCVRVRICVVCAVYVGVSLLSPQDHGPRMGTEQVIFPLPLSRLATQIVCLQGMKRTFHATDLVRRSYFWYGLIRMSCRVLRLSRVRLLPIECHWSGMEGQTGH